LLSLSRVASVSGQLEAAFHAAVSQQNRRAAGQGQHADAVAGRQLADHEGLGDIPRSSTSRISTSPPRLNAAR